MSRIRTIKPEFPQSEAIGRLSREARLLFIQLWTLVDDEGRARAASRMLASLLYPYDDDAPTLVIAWLGELERAGMIRIYDVDCSRYLDIPNWLKHQKIDRPSKSRLPAFNDNSPKPREESRSLAADLGPRTLDLGSSGSGERARPLVSETSIRLAEELATIAGFPDPKGWPVGWCGAPLRVQAMLDSGWSAGTMIATTRAIVGRKRDGPIESFSYFEKPFARAHAMQNLPLPVVEINSEPERIHARAVKPTSPFQSAYDKLKSAARGLSEGSADVVGLLPDGRGARS